MTRQNQAFGDQQLVVSILCLYRLGALNINSPVPSACLSPIETHSEVI